MYSIYHISQAITLFYIKYRNFNIGKYCISPLNIKYHIKYQILNWETLKLELNQATITSIYEQLPKLKTNNCILAKDFLNNIKTVLLKAYAMNNPEKVRFDRQIKIL